MIIHRSRPVATSFLTISLLCLLLLSLAPITSSQQPTTADLSPLVRNLKDKDAKVRAEAVRQMIALGEAAKPAVPVLVDALADSDAKVRYRAVIALGNLWSGNESGPESEAAVPALVKLLKDKDWYTRWRSMRVLGQIGPTARAALPALNKIMRDREDPLWAYASGTIKHIERPPTNDVRALARFLKDKDPKVRAQAAERLSSEGMRGNLMGTSFDAEPAIPALIEALKDPETMVRYHSLSALDDFMFKVEPPDLGAIVPTVAELLKDDYSGTRWQAAGLLGRIGPRASAAVPLLTQALSDGDKVVRGYSAYALGEIGAESKVAAPSLIKLLKDPVPDVRESAATALSKVEPSSAGVVIAALTEDLKHENPSFSGRAARALGHFGPEAKPVTLLLARMLTTQDYFWRHETVRALGKIGPGAREAAPALRRVLNDSVDYIRVAAAVALLKIAPESQTEIAPDLVKQAKAELEKEAAAVRTPIRMYVGDPGTKWDEAKDLLSRGLYFYREGNLDAAVADFTEALEVDPEFADAYHHRGVVHRRRGEHMAALVDFTQAIESDYRSTEKHYLARGATHLDKHNYDGAIADLNETIKQNAYNADAYYHRGLAHQRMGNLDAAVADYDSALKIVPPATKAFGARGAAKLAQGKVAEALADFEEAVKAEPKDAANYESLGDAYARLGDTGKARDAWGKALSLASNAESRTRLTKKLSGATKQ